MGRFLVHGVKPDTGETARFWYDNQNSTLTTEDGTEVSLGHIPVEGYGDLPEVTPVSKDSPGVKTGAIRVLKIQLGLSCNYSCEYCSQRFVPHADSTSRRDLDGFLAQLETWFDGGEDGLGQGVQIQFWGGEPFVYWKTLKPLAERLKERYPKVTFWMPTNGSLLDDEKIDWLDQLGFSISISHDGPGQFVRGPDPLEDPEKREVILKLFHRFHPQGRISFNSCLNKQNRSRAAIGEFFKSVTGVEDVQIGEGSFIDPYDDGGLSASLDGEEDMKDFSRQAFEELKTAAAHPLNWQIARNKVMGFLKTLKYRRPGAVLGQKCRMDRPDNIAVDLKGNVLTCQNVSAAATAPNGNPHKIGHVSKLEDVRLTTATHWSHRKDCASCPVLQLCGGSCMFLEGTLWDKACDNSFADNLPFFAVAFEIATGFLPVKIEGGRKDREDLWNASKPKKVIPIKKIN